MEKKRKRKKGKKEVCFLCPVDREGDMKMKKNGHVHSLPLS